MVEEKTGGAKSEPMASHKLSRKQRKDKTRQCLIDAVIDIARREGVEALTTTRLARTAGITQPAFYVHFKNVEHCLEITAEQVFERIFRFQSETRRLARLLIKSPEEIAQRATVAAVYEQALSLALAEPRFLGLALRYRRDTSSALGQSVRRAFDQARQDMAEDLRGVAQRAGMPDAFRMRCDLYADFVVWLFLGALEALIDNRYQDRETVVSILAQATASLMLAEMQETAAAR